MPGRWETIFDEPSREELERALPRYLAERRWFRSKSKRVRDARIVAAFPMPFGGTDVARVALVEVTLEDGTRDTYVLPLAFIYGDLASRVAAARPHAIVLPLSITPETRSGAPREGVVVDALTLEGFLGELLSALGRGATFADAGAELRFSPLGAVPSGAITATVVDREQTNTSVVFGDRFVGKIVRKLEPGESPALEVGRFLGEVGYPHTPALAGCIEVHRPGTPPSTLGLLHVLVPNRGDAWELARASLERLFDAPSPEVIEIWSALAEKLGRRAGELHVALVSRSEDAAFAPEPLDVERRSAIARAARTELDRVLEALRARDVSLSTDARAALAEVSLYARDLEARLARVMSFEDAGIIARVHGDFHLGQVLVTASDFAIIDFEGEPTRPPAERKAKRSPLVDVAGMLRSFHYASSTALRARPEASRAALAEWGARWHDDACAAFVRGWLSAVEGTCVAPDDPAATRALLDLFVLEKAIYEAHYELDNRPDWIDIPLDGLRVLLSRGGSSGRGTG